MEFVELNISKEESPLKWAMDTLGGSWMNADELEAYRIVRNYLIDIGELEGKKIYGKEIIISQED